MTNHIYYGDNLTILKDHLPSNTFDLIYIDPPFNTGHDQVRTEIRTKRALVGDRVGFQNRQYSTSVVGTKSFKDSFDNFTSFLRPRLMELKRVLSYRGTMYFHIDYREVHYCKVLLDEIFGRECFLNEIIWAYDYGGRPKNKWPPKHDNILVYVKNPKHHIFNYEAIERIPYMAPGLVSKEKALAGKVPTDVWWHTIVPTNGAEKTGYPTQKPLGIIRRIIQASSLPESQVLDVFAGSGTFGYAALEYGRKFTLVDANKEAIDVMKKRFSNVLHKIELHE